MTRFFLPIDPVFVWVGTLRWRFELEPSQTLSDYVGVEHMQALEGTFVAWGVCIHFIAYTLTYSLISNECTYVILSRDDGW